MRKETFQITIATTTWTVSMEHYLDVSQSVTEAWQQGCGVVRIPTAHHDHWAFVSHATPVVIHRKR